MFTDSTLPTRLLVSVIAAVVVALAEIYFIIREDLRAEKERKKVWFYGDVILHNLYSVR